MFGKRNNTLCRQEVIQEIQVCRTKIAFGLVDNKIVGR